MMEKNSLYKPTPTVEPKPGRVGIGGRVMDFNILQHVGVVAPTAPESRYVERVGQPITPAEESVSFGQPYGNYTTTGPVENFELSGEAAGEMVLTDAVDGAANRQELIHHVALHGVIDLSTAEIDALIKELELKGGDLSFLESNILSELYIAKIHQCSSDKSLIYHVFDRV